MVEKIPLLNPSILNSTTTIRDSEISRSLKEGEYQEVPPGDTVDAGEDEIKLD